jgi:hypothetical protein
MKESLECLFQTREVSLEPGVLLVGDLRYVFHNAPYGGNCQVSFSPGSLYVPAVGPDEELEVVVTVYRGTPYFETPLKNKFLFDGLIEVGEEGIEVNTNFGAGTKIPWPESLTSVLVVLDAQEAAEWKIQTITIYIEPFILRDRFKIKKWLRKLGRVFRKERK